MLFSDLVSHLSYSPSVITQLTFYMRRLRREQLTRRLSVVAGILALLFQIVAVMSPPTPLVASSTNDIIFGGLSSENTKADLLKLYDADRDSSGHSGIQALFERFDVGRTELAALQSGTISASDRSLKALGRNPHSTQDAKYAVGGQTYYLRPLYSWGEDAKYQALVGTTRSGNYFAILNQCGNLVTKITPPDPTSHQTPPRAIGPQINLSKTARNLNQLGADGLPIDASTAEAQAGDLIEYVLSAANTGSVTAMGYVATESINDLLEYAAVTELGGGNLDQGTLTWPRADIAPLTSHVNTFRIQIKNPVPGQTTSISDPQSYDLRMDNVYGGNKVSIVLAPPASKQVELAVQSLPATGGPTSLLIMVVFVGLIVYFYLRNRQLTREIHLLRVDT